MRLPGYSIGCLFVQDSDALESLVDCAAGRTEWVVDDVLATCDVREAEHRVQGQ